MAFSQFWSSIYKHMHASIPEAHTFIDRYYQDMILPAEILKEEKRYLWFSIETKSAGDVIRMAQTYPSYKNYL